MNQSMLTEKIQQEQYKLFIKLSVFNLFLQYPHKSVSRLPPEWDSDCQQNSKKHHNIRNKVNNHE